MNIINQIALLIISIPFGIFIFFPAIIISIFLLFIIFYKKKEKENISINTNNDLLSREENKKESFLNFIFKKDQIFYYRYLVIISFLLILMIGAYDPIFYCSYVYSMIVQIAIIISVYIFLRLIKQILIFAKVKFTRIIMLILIVFSILSYSSIFISNVIKQGIFSFSDSVKPVCYGFYPPREKIKIIPEVPILGISHEEKTTNTFKYNPNGPYPSPLVDKNIMINARGEVVEKSIRGTFKTVGTNKTFEYSEGVGNTIDNCIKSNCKKTYFADDTYITYGSGAKFNDTDNPAIGKVVKIEFYSKGEKVVSYPNPHDISDSATYTILYSQNSKSGQTITYSEDLCMGTKGGGQYCYEPHYKIGAVAIFLNEENKSSLTSSHDSVFFTGKITEAELVSYQYSMSPDTGEVFPVVTR